MISAREHTARLAGLLSGERSAMAEFLVDLAAFDRGRRWLELGYPSLFDFLHRELGLSKGAAHYRKVGAALVQKFPEIVEPLRDGRLCVTALVEVAKVLTAENAREVLPRFFHASRRDAMALAAEIRPAEAPPQRVVVTAVRPPAPKRSEQRDDGGTAAPALTPARSATGVQPAELDGTGFQLAPPPRPAPRAFAEPLTAERSRLHVTVSRRFLAKLEKARDALSHSHPGASEEEILEAGLDLLLARDARRKGLVAKPRSAPPPHPGPLPRSRGGEGRGSGRVPAAVERRGSGRVPAAVERRGSGRVPSAVERSGSGRIPAAVKRAVWIRDGGRCRWPLASGGICGSTVRLQFDHIEPLALGGASTVENVRVACAVHDDLAARLVFGDEWMDRYTRGGGPGSRRGPQPPP